MSTKYPHRRPWPFFLWGFRVAVVSALAAAVLLVVGVWVRDPRWGQTAVLPASLALASTITWYLAHTSEDIQDYELRELGQEVEADIARAENTIRDLYIIAGQAETAQNAEWAKAVRRHQDLLKDLRQK